MSTTFNAENENDAANKIWSEISKNIAGNVPNFVFTIKDKDTNELSNWKVKETPIKKYVDYKITKIDMKMNENQQQKFIDKTNELDEDIENLIHKNQNGGKRKEKRYKKIESDDDSDSSSDEESIYNKYALFTATNRQKPIVYWWYTPTIYKIDSFYVPTFYSPVYPYVEINLSSAIME